MKRNQSEKGEGVERKREETFREEQGDLLADAVSGAFPGPPSGAGPGTESGSQGEVPPGKPEAAPEGGESRGGEEKAGSITLPGTPGSSQGEDASSDDSLVRDFSPDESSPDAPPVGGTIPIPDTPWERKMAWAKERARAGMREEAVGLYRELVEDEPSSVRALNNLGVLLDEMGDAQGAVTHLAVARNLDPRNQEVLGNFGAALAAAGRYGEAEEVLRQAHRLDPSNPETRANLGVLLFRRGLYDEAEAELGVVCASSPENGLAFYYRGEALNRLGRVEEAVEALERVLELSPMNSRAHYTLGVLFDKKNQPEKAAVMYRKARELANP